MKKIMILMLSLAVLFSFAACDNISTTPDDQQQGGGSSATFTDGQIVDIAEAISGLFTGADGLVAKFGAAITNTDGTLKSGYECASPYTKLVYKYDTVAADGLEGATDVTITIEGQDITEEDVKNVEREIILARYTVEFTTSWQEYPTADYSELKGTVSGAIKGGVDIDLETASTKLAITPSIDCVIMPDTTSVTVDGVAVDNAKLVSVFASTKYASSNLSADKYTTAKAYEDGCAETAKKDMNTYVEFLLDATKQGDNSLIKVLDAIIKNADLKGTLTNTYTEGSTTAKASAKLEYTAAAGDAFSVVGSTDKAIDIVNLTLNLEAASATATTGSFTPATFELSGTFKVYSDTGRNKPEEDFTEITLTGVTGTASGLVTGVAKEVTDLLDSKAVSDNKVVTLTFDADGGSTKGTVSADVLTKVGPEVVDGELAALGDVTINYEKDATLFVAP